MIFGGTDSARHICHLIRIDQWLTHDAFGAGVTRTFGDPTLRIIAGKFRGRKLKSPPTEQTRPTSDRLRETLFNVLAPRLEGARFLDLCGGTGAVGLEALSRGAAHVTFVDRSRKMCGVNEKKLESPQND